MPTANDFDLAALDLDGVVDRLQGFTWNLVRTVDPSAMAGDALTTLIDRSVETLLTDASTAGTQCALLAELCRRRAEVCREHDRQWEQYEIRMAEYRRLAAAVPPGGYVGSPPMPPTRPAHWVDRG